MDALDQAEHVVPPQPVTAQPDWRHGGFGVYVHWPFCLAKCPYCDFNSHVTRRVDHAAWRKALCAEAAHMRQFSGPRAVDTVFFGGGTPSLMPPQTVAAVVEAIDRLWGLKPGAEISLEANPTSVEAVNFEGYAAAGVTRLSMGVQALNDADLKALGRRHSAAEAARAFDLARTYFDRVSFDLIYARMGQTVEAWQSELRQALDMAVDHLSLYQLTIEQGTRFAELHARGRLRMPEDGLAAEMYQVTQDMTSAAGMPAYEISNHARPGAESRHNALYWRYGDYAGVGPGAHGRLTDADGVRWALSTERSPEKWMAGVDAKGHAIENAEAIPASEQATEYLMMSLRLAEGADPVRYANLAGAQLPRQRIDELVDMGLLSGRDGRLCATPSGRAVLNSLLSQLLV